MRIYMRSKLNGKVGLSIFILLIFGCSQKASKEQQLVNKYFDEINISKNEREGSFILFPGSGCFGCTEKTISWLMQNKEKTKDYKLIFGRRKENDVYINSLQHTFSLYYDKDNKMGGYEFGYGYPFFITIDQNRNITIIPFKSDSSTPFGF